MEGFVRSVTAFALLVSLLCVAVNAVAQVPSQAPIQIVVEGERRHPREPSQDDAMAGSVVRREKLAAPGVSVADVLRAENGVEIVEYGGFGSTATASIRGATAAQTPVYLAGIRLNDEVAGAADLSAVPLWFVDRVEIYRGNAPIAADEFGIGGAIMFEPRKRRTSSAGAELWGGSFGATGGHAWAAAGTEGRAALVGASLMHAENDYAFDDDRGTLYMPGDDAERRRQNADVSVLDAWALGRFDLPGGARVDVLGSVVQREQGVPRLALLPSHKARARYERVLLGTRAQSSFGPENEHQVELATSFVGARSVYDDPAYELALLVPRLEIDGRRVAQRVLTHVKLSPSLELTGALDASVDQLLREDGDVGQMRADARSGRAALGLSWQPWEGVFFLPTLGLSCRSATEGSGVCDRGEPVGRIAVAHRARSIETFVGVGRYVRFPSLGEVHGAGILVRGNPHLVPEEGLTAELGGRLRRSAGPLFFWGEAAAYTRSPRRLISYVRSTQGYLVPVNVQAARVSGFEAGAGVEFDSLFGADFGLTLLDPRNVTEGRRGENDVLPFHSRFKASAGLSARTRAHLPGAVDRSRARLGLLYQSSRYADPAGLIVIPDQSSLDLELEQGFSGERIKSRARIANLTDARRFDVVGYPLPGRGVFVSMEVLLK